MIKPRLHVFVCNNARPEEDPRGCCLRRRGEEIYETLKALAKTDRVPGLRVTRTGCLGECADGAVMVVYPEGTWYGKVKPNDLEEIISSHLIAGKIVERLKLLTS